MSYEEADAYFNLDYKTKVKFYRGKGCPECGHTGYSGLLPIQELFMMNNEARALVAKGASMLEIEQAAARAGFSSMRYDGLKKVIRGLTTIEEIERVTIEED